MVGAAAARGRLAHRVGGDALRRSRRADGQYRRCRRCGCDLLRAAAARQALVRDSDQQPLALFVRVRAGRENLFRRADRGLRPARRRRGSRQFSRRDRGGRPQRRRRAGSGGDHPRARDRSRGRPAGTARGADDARVDCPRRGTASQGEVVARRLCAARARAVDHLDRRAVAQGRAQLLGLRPDRRARHRARSAARQSDRLEGALPRHDLARLLQAHPFGFLPAALSVHHGERPARAVRLFHAGGGPRAGRGLGEGPACSAGAVCG